MTGWSYLLQISGTAATDTMGGFRMSTLIDNPIPGSPYEQPDRHFGVGHQGPTGDDRNGRRPSESGIPMAVTRKGTRAGTGRSRRGSDFDATGADNYYRQRGLILTDLEGGLEHIRIDITNYHAFLLRDAKEIRGAAEKTRLLLKNDRGDDRFRESLQVRTSRVLRDLGGTVKDKSQIVVFNDEAHHCYQGRVVTAGEKDVTERPAYGSMARRPWRSMSAIYRLPVPSRTSSPARSRSRSSTTKATKS